MIKKKRVNRFALIIGSLFPDILDKTLLFLGLSSGRETFHSLFFIILSFLILFLISKRNVSISFSFFIGTLFHLILDLPDIPLFFPFISYSYEPLIDPIAKWIAFL
ncbi:unnamed protein product, partial [marine sediment metagenome]